MNKDTLKITGIDGHTELRLTPGGHRTAHLEILAPGDRVRGLAVALTNGDLYWLAHYVSRNEPDHPDIIQVISHVGAPTYITWGFEGRFTRVSVRRMSGPLYRTVLLSWEDVRRLSFGLKHMHDFGEIPA